MGFRLVQESVTLNGVMTADPRYICGSWACFLCQDSYILVLVNWFVLPFWPSV